MNYAIRHRCLNAELLALVMMASASSLQGQEAQYKLVDRIVAVVGTTPIPMSRVEEQLQMLRLQNQSIPTDSASFDMLRRGHSRYADRGGDAGASRGARHLYLRHRRRRAEPRGRPA